VSSYATQVIDSHCHGKFASDISKRKVLFTIFHCKLMKSFDSIFSEIIPKCITPNKYAQYVQQIYVSELYKCYKQTDFWEHD
jgi:hypothetical protein